MTVIEQMRGKPLPEYRNTLFLEGYNPYEILEAARNSVKAQEAAETQPEQSPLNVHFQVEVNKR